MVTFFVWKLLQPFPVLALLTAVGLLALWRRRREARRLVLLAAVPFALLVILSVPAVAYRLRGSLEWQYPALPGRPEGVDAIVVLGSQAFPPDGPGSGPDLDESGLDRCLRAAEVYRQGSPCPVVLSGGKPDPGWPGPTPAEAMRGLLLRLGVAPADLVVEDRSRTTYENAVESARTLRERGLRRVVLVTDAIHLPRAVGCFRKQQVAVVPCGCCYRATPYSEARYGVVPSAGSMVESQRSCHEWLGLAWYWLWGRV